MLQWCASSSSPRRRLLAGRRRCAVPGCTGVVGEGAEGFGVEGGGGGVGGSAAQQGETAAGGDGEIRAFLGSHLSALARGSRCCLVVRGQDSFDEEGKEEDEDDEKEDETDESKAMDVLRVPVQLLLLTSLTILFFSFLLFGVWVLPEVFLRGFFCETASGFVLVSSFAWFGGGYICGAGWCFSVALAPGSYLFRAGFAKGVQSCGLFWEITSKLFRIQLFLVGQCIHISISLRRPGFHAEMLEGGPRMPFLRSIPSCAGGFWTNFPYFPDEVGFGS